MLSSGGAVHDAYCRWAPRLPPTRPSGPTPLPHPPPPQKLIRYMTQGIDMSAAFVPATKWVLTRCRGGGAASWAARLAAPRCLHWGCA